MPKRDVGVSLAWKGACACIAIERHMPFWPGGPGWQVGQRLCCWKGAQRDPSAHHVLLASLLLQVRVKLLRQCISVCCACSTKKGAATQTHTRMQALDRTIGQHHNEALQCNARQMRRLQTDRAADHNPLPPRHTPRMQWCLLCTNLRLPLKKNKKKIRSHVLQEKL
jgi:hypothetical protein